MRGPRMALGFLAVLVLLSAGQVLEWFWIVPDGVRFPFEAMTSEGALYWSDVVEGTWGLHGSRVGAGLLGLGFHWLPAQWDVGPWFTLIMGLVFIFTIVLTGGAITRAAALDEVLPVRASVRSIFSQVTPMSRALLGSILVPLACILAAVCFLLLGRLLLWLPVVKYVGAVLYGFSLLVGGGLALGVLLFIAAFPLVVSAITAGRLDAIEGVERAVLYVMRRPFRFFAAWGIGLLFLVLVFGFLTGLASLATEVTAALTGTDRVLSGAPGTLYPLEGDAPVTGFVGAVVGLWHRVLIDLVWAWCISFIFSWAAVIYDQLRRSVDGPSAEQVWQPGTVPGTDIPAGLREDVVRGLARGEAALRQGNDS